MADDKESVYRWFYIVIDFFLEREPDFVFMKDLRQSVDSIKSQRSVRGLKALKKELETEFIVELSKNEQSELETRLNEKAFTPGDLSKQISEILHRDQIDNDDECRMLENHVDVGSENIEQVNQLLIAYYKSKET